MNNNVRKLVLLGMFLLLFLSMFSVQVKAQDTVLTKQPTTRVPPWMRDQAPTITITNPTDGATFEAGAIITITTVASDDNGIVSQYITVMNEDHTGDTYNWDTTGLDDGNYQISATAIDTADQIGTDSIVITLGSGGEPPSGDGIVNKYAIITGISDYKTISDLSFCDEDASDWYNYLEPLGYQIILLGDGTNTYPRAIDALATEANIKNTVANIISQADADDIIVYTSSGHGTDVKEGRGRTATYVQAICTWDCSAGEDGEDGLLYDIEFSQMWATAVSDVFIFLDHCFSGGMDELFSNANADCFYMTTTCTDDGYGWDVPDYNNGMWTYYYLELSLVGQGFTNLHDAFVYAHDEAVAAGFDGGDEPQEFGVADFYL